MENLRTLFSWHLKHVAEIGAFWSNRHKDGELYRAGNDAARLSFLVREGCLTEGQKRNFAAVLWTILWISLKELCRISMIGRIRIFATGERNRNVIMRRISQWTHPVIPIHVVVARRLTARSHMGSGVPKPVDDASALPPAETNFVTMMDRWWNGTPAATVPSPSSIPQRVSSPVRVEPLDVSELSALAPESSSSWVESMFLDARSALGVESWALLVCFGGAVRLATLYFSLYGERAAARMQCAMPELKPAHDAFQRVYYHPNSRLQVQQAATVLKAMRRRVFAAHQTSNAKTLAGLGSAPFVLQGFYVVSKLCEHRSVEFGLAAFGWCPALMMPDPLYILPALCCGLTLLNLELTLSRRAELKKGFLGNVVMACRCLCVACIPVMAQMKVGTLLYWVGLSLVGLLQPILVRSTPFCAWFGIPEPPVQPPQSSNPESSPTDDLQLRRLVVQMPYLSYIFEPEAASSNAAGVPGSCAPPSPSPSPPLHTLEEVSASNGLSAFDSEEAAAFRREVEQRPTSVNRPTNGASFPASSRSWKGMGKDVNRAGPESVTDALSDWIKK